MDDDGTLSSSEELTIKSNLNVLIDDLLIKMDICSGITV